MYKNRKFSSNEESKKNGYRLSRQIFELAKTCQEEIKPGHIALYFWICELNNKLGWGQDVIGLPTMEAMNMIGMKDRRFYRRILTELDSFGLIRIVKLSTNQHFATQVKLILNDRIINTPNKAIYSYSPDNIEVTNKWQTSGSYSDWDDDEKTIPEWLPGDPDPSEDQSET